MKENDDSKAISVLGQIAQTIFLDCFLHPQIVELKKVKNTEIIPPGNWF